VSKLININWHFAIYRAIADNDVVTCAAVYKDLQSFYE
jgi:hypothetical protein